MLAALRLIHRGLKRQCSVTLVNTRIPPGRNPVPHAGVADLFGGVRLGLVSGGAEEPRIGVAREVCSIKFTRRALLPFYVATAEALDGEGDFSIRCVVQSEGGADVRDFWFWGFANPHSVNSF